MKNKLLFAALLACVLLLCGCASRPSAAVVEETPEDGQMISGEPESGSELQFSATLYFPYADTGLLRQEMREITMAPNETREKALVSALLEGSREAGSRALFPEKTEVLSTQAQQGVIYITFNEALYNSYADEGRSQRQFQLRRQLAMAALTATLTESGEYHSVQVLVRAEENVGRSMRLQQSYFGGGEEGAAAPFTRQHSALPTPAAYARELLLSWQERDWDALSAFLSARRSRGGQALDMGSLADGLALTEFAVYDGTVSPDGGSAVVCADLLLRDKDGLERRLESYPLRLENEDGAWKASALQLLDVMGESNE